MYLARLLSAWPRRDRVEVYRVEVEREVIAEVPPGDVVDVVAQVIDAASAHAGASDRAITAHVRAIVDGAPARSWPVRVAPPEIDAADATRAEASTASIVAESLRHTRAMVAHVLQQSSATATAATTMLRETSAMVGEITRLHTAALASHRAEADALRERARAAEAAQVEAERLAREAVDAAESASEKLSRLGDNPLLALARPILADAIRDATAGAKARIAAPVNGAPPRAEAAAPQGDGARGDAPGGDA